MPRLKDAASMAALDSPIPGGGIPPLDPAMMGGAMAPPPEAAAGGDIEGAFSTIEASLEGAPPDKAEEARAHINALREITASLGSEAPPPTEEEPPTNPDEVPPEVP